MADDTLQARWDFICENSKWSWRRVEPSGFETARSALYPTFGTAIGEAMENGFHPDRDYWLLEDGDVVSYFAPGKVPDTIRKLDLRVADERRG